MVDRVVKGGKYIYRGYEGRWVSGWSGILDPWNEYNGKIVIALDDAGGFLKGDWVDVRVEEDGQLIEEVPLDYLE